MPSNMKFSRVLLKLSGESLMGDDNYGINNTVLAQYTSQIQEIANQGVQVAIVIGGGNIFRGLSGTSKGFDRVRGDQMGMLATVINSLALQSSLESVGCSTDVFTAVRMEPVGKLYCKFAAVESMKSGRVVIIAGGTGNPYFTTDTASALRAIELEADALLKGTRVDGVYDSDPEKNPNAVKYDRVKFSEAYDKKLKIMDLTAFTMCQENDMPIIVFDMDTVGNLKKLILGEKIGSVVEN